MKKLKSAIVIFICLSCFLKKSVAQDTTLTTSEMTAINQFFVDEGELRTHVERYKRKKQKRVDKKVVLFGGHRDAYNIWFDSTKLFTFFAAAKKIAERDGKHRLSGVRYYYAMYPKTHEPKKYESSHTLVIVPTEECKSIDCDRHKEINQRFGIILNHDIKRDSKLFVLFVKSELNNGTLCPPMDPKYCNGALY